MHESAAQRRCLPASVTVAAVLIVAALKQSDIAHISAVRGAFFKSASHSPDVCFVRPIQHTAKAILGTGSGIPGSICAGIPGDPVLFIEVADAIVTTLPALGATGGA